MNSHPTQDVVLAELGDKITAAIAASVSAAHDDLVTYRDQHAGWLRIIPSGDWPTGFMTGCGRI
jgi:hypothetical protein